MPEYRLTRLRGKWAIAVWEGGKRIERASTGTADRKEAERELERVKALAAIPAHITVAYVWRRYREENAHKRISANMEFSGKSILPAFGDLRPDEVTTARCRAYLKKRRKAKRKVGTVWTELNHLQTALNWAAKERIIDRAPAVEKPPKPAPRTRRLTRAEVRRLLDSAGAPHVALAIALMIGTAARVGALLELTWDRVDFERGLIALGDPDAATGRLKGRATVPMTRDLRHRLSEAKKGALTDYVIEWGGEPVKSLKTGFRFAVAKAGLKGVTPHVLRHTAATWMAEKGNSMERIAAVLGHSDSRTTERIYAKFRPDYLRETVSALEMDDDETGSGEPEST